MMITPAFLVDALRMPMTRALDRAESINEAFRYAEINTPLRAAHYLAQVGHETLNFRYRREVWGPTAAQLRYERNLAAPWPVNPEQAGTKAFAVNRLAYRLGNHRAGDGLRYMGRGDLQTTGRGNYRRLTQRLRDRGLSCPDFEAEPAALEQPQWLALSAADYWVMRGLNRFADADDITTLTKRINGGLNGFAHRQALYTAVCAALMKG